MIIYVVAYNNFIGEVHYDSREEAELIAKSSRVPNTRVLAFKRIDDDE